MYGSPRPEAKVNFVRQRLMIYIRPYKVGTYTLIHLKTKKLGEHSEQNYRFRKLYIFVTIPITSIPIKRSPLYKAGSEENDKTSCLIMMLTLR